MVIFIATSNYQRVTWKTLGFSSSYIVCLKIAGWTILTVEIWVHHGIWLSFHASWKPHKCSLFLEIYCQPPLESHRFWEVGFVQDLLPQITLTGKSPWFERWAIPLSPWLLTVARPKASRHSEFPEWESSFGIGSWVYSTLDKLKLWEYYQIDVRRVWSPGP